MTPPQDKNTQPQKSDNELGLFTRFFEKIGAQVAEIIANVKRISHYASPPEDALIAYPATTVTVATPIKPGNPDIIAAGGAAGYDRVQIFFNGQRISDKVWVINDGPASLFVIASYNLIKWGGEDEILPGEWRAFTTIYELRVRSPDGTTKYRVTEYEPWLDSGYKTLIASGSATLVSIAASGEDLIIDALDVSSGKTLDLQLTCTFNAAAVAGSTVNLYGSTDGTTYDTVANAGTVWVTAINNPVSAGNIRTKSSNPIDVSGKQNVKIYVANQDAAQTLTAVTVRYALYK